MPRKIPDAGRETISETKPVHITDSAYVGMTRLADGMSFQASPLSYQSGDMPVHIPVGAQEILHSIQKIGSESERIKQEHEEKTSGLLKANLYPAVTSYLDNMDLHMQIFAKQYLQEHPDGAGLRQAVARELADGLTVSFSGNNWVDNANNIIMGGLRNLDPDVENYAKQSIYKISHNAIARATNTEFAAGQAYREKQRLVQLHNLKIEASNVNKLSDFQDIATKFVGLVDGMRAEAGDDTAQLFADEHSLDISSRAIHSLAVNNPQVFLEAEQSGVFKDKILPSIVENEKTRVIEHLAQQELRSQRQQAIHARQMLYQQQKNTYKDLLARIRQDPMSVSDDEIINSLNTKYDINTLFAQKKVARKREEQYYKALSNSVNDILSGNGISHFAPQDQLDIVHTYSGNEGKSNAIENPIAIVEIANDLQNTAVDKRLIDKYNIEIDRGAELLVLNALSSDDNQQDVNMARIGQIMGAYKQAYDTGQSILGLSPDKEDMANSKLIEACVLLMDVRGIEPIDAQDENFDLNDPQNQARLTQYQEELSSILFTLKDNQLNKKGNDNELAKIETGNVNSKLNTLKKQTPGFERFYNKEREDLEEIFKRSSWWSLGIKFNTDSIPQWEKEDIMAQFDQTMSEALSFQRMGCSADEAQRMAKAKFYKKYTPTVIYGLPKGEEKCLMLHAPEKQIPNSQITGSSAQTQLILRTATLLHGIETAINRNAIPYLDSFIEKGLKVKYINPPKVQYDADDGYPKITEYQHPQFEIVGTDKKLDIEFNYDEYKDAYQIRFVYIDEDDNIVRSTPLRAKNGHIQYICFNTDDIIKATEQQYYKHSKKTKVVMPGEQNA